MTHQSQKPGLLQFLQFQPRGVKPLKKRGAPPAVVTDRMMVDLSREAFIAGDFQRSEWLIDIALELNSRNDEAYELKADVCYMLNRTSEAADYYHETLNLRSEQRRKAQ
jgi:hypothetical protein